MVGSGALPPHVGAMQSAIRRAGIPEARIIRWEPESEPFGDTSVVFHLGPILLRVTRDRGQEFVDVASRNAPTTFYQFDDLAIAMGWSTPEHVLSRQDPEALDLVLHRLGGQWPIIVDAFSDERERSTTRQLEDAAGERGRVLLRMLDTQAGDR